MANTERIRLPEDVYTALRRESKGSASGLITNVIHDFISGKKDLQVPPHTKKIEKDTSIVADERLIKAAKDYAKSKGLSFNKAVVMMLEQSLTSIQH